MHRICTVVTSWFSMLAVTVPLAVLAMLALPSGAPVQIATHAALLVAGAAIVVGIERGQQPS
jgi:hypothetical protein